MVQASFKQKARYELAIFMWKSRPKDPGRPWIRRVTSLRVSKSDVLKSLQVDSEIMVVFMCDNIEPSATTKVVAR